jgi:hypothetical protein
LADEIVSIDASARLSAKLVNGATLIGQGRAGFYSDSPWWDACVDVCYRVLSREQGREPVRYRPRNTDRIVSAWRTSVWADAILDGPPGTAYDIVRQIEPNRSLVIFTDTHLPYMLPAGLGNRVSGRRATRVDPMVALRYE